MLTKHIVLEPSNNKSVSIDKSSEDILLTKKAKDAYSLIGDLLLTLICILLFIIIFLL